MDHGSQHDPSASRSVPELPEEIREQLVKAGQLHQIEEMLTQLRSGNRGGLFENLGSTIQVVKAISNAKKEANRLGGSQPVTHTEVYTEEKRWSSEDGQWHTESETRESWPEESNEDAPWSSYDESGSQDSYSSGNPSYSNDLGIPNSRYTADEGNRGLKTVLIFLFLLLSAGGVAVYLWLQGAL